MIDDWNVVITVHEGCFREALQFLEEFGEVSRTDYFNVLAMKTGEPYALLEQFQGLITVAPESLTFFARVIPVSHSFYFKSVQEFENNAKEVVASMVPRLAGKKFFVRIHRRGFKGRLVSTEEERFLDDFLLHLLEENGSPGYINFKEPDAIVVVETIGQYAGFALFTREELARFSLLKLR